MKKAGKVALGIGIVAAAGATAGAVALTKKAKAKKGVKKLETEKDNKKTK